MTRRRRQSMMMMGGGGEQKAEEEMPSRIIIFWEGTAIPSRQPKKYAFLDKRDFLL
jgi:hypothetical protein